MLYKYALLLAYLGLYTTAIAQNSEKKKWSVMAGYEVNFMGNNALIHLQHFRKEVHLLEGGVSYNLSDGFADRPVLGLDIGYGYRLLSKDKWSMYTGVDYRLQRPISILNIQTITYTQSIQYRPIARVQATARVGYGVATARARSAGTFTQTNSPTGSLLLSCGYLF